MEAAPQMAESLDAPATGRFAHLPVVVIVVGDEAEGLAAVTAGGIGLVDGHGRAVQHAIAEHLVGMIVERSEKPDPNLAEILEVRIGDVAGRAVVFDQVLIVLIVRSGELREWTQVVGRAGVWLERTRRGWAGRIVAAGAGSGRLGPGGTSQHGGDHDDEGEAHGYSVGASRRNMAMASISTSRSGRQSIA